MHILKVGLHSSFEDLKRKSCTIGWLGIKLPIQLLTIEIANKGAKFNLKLKMRYGVE